MMNVVDARYAGMIVAGMALGILFYGGLWATVRRLPSLKNPGLLLLASVVLRTTAVLVGFWYLSSGNPGSIVACLMGFIAVRLLATHGSGARFLHQRGSRSS